MVNTCEDVSGTVFAFLMYEVATFSLCDLHEYTVELTNISYNLIYIYISPYFMKHEM